MDATGIQLVLDQRIYRGTQCDSVMKDALVNAELEWGRNFRWQDANFDHLPNAGFLQLKNPPE